MNPNETCFSSITKDKPWHCSLIRDINTKLSDNSVSLSLFSPHTLSVTPFPRWMRLSFISSKKKKQAFVYEWQWYYFLRVCVLHALICLASRNWFIQMCIKLSHFEHFSIIFCSFTSFRIFSCISLCFIHGQNQRQSWSQHKCVAYSSTCYLMGFFLLSYISILCLTCFCAGTPEIWICIQLWQVPVKSTMAFKISSFYVLQPYTWVSKDECG